jgi:hypothetical protein
MDRLEVMVRVINRYTQKVAAGERPDPAAIKEGDWVWWRTRAGELRAVSHVLWREGDWLVVETDTLRGIVERAWVPIASVLVHVAAEEVTARRTRRVQVGVAPRPEAGKGARRKKGKERGEKEGGGCDPTR